MSFGRKGLAEGAAVVDEVRPATWQAQPRGAAQPACEMDDEGKSAFDLADKKRWFLGAVALVFIVVSLDDYLSGTSLITPINSSLSYVVTSVCAVIGFMLGFYRWLTDPGGSRGIRTTLGLFLGAPLLAGAWGNVTVWRIAEHLSFDFSNAQWVSARYPVTTVHQPSHRYRMFSHYTASIDPYHAGSTEIPITEEQYESFYDATGDLCITVAERHAADGAIQIRTRGSTGLTLDTVPEIALC